eukprot:c8373_g1_i1.p1 GENE.c8373_g1_i1~~c8373_g1_i1.p1  ORF type:complete len:392 (-),score=102.81 c8373_g1_i1:52-1227(-)
MFSQQKQSFILENDYFSKIHSTPIPDSRINFCKLALSFLVVYFCVLCLDIVNLPEDALNTPMGAMLRPWIENMHNQLGVGYGHAQQQQYQPQPNSSSQASIPANSVAPLTQQQKSFFLTKTPDAKAVTTVSFDSGNMTGIKKKLKEFSQEQNDRANSILELVDVLDRRQQLSESNDESIRALASALSDWPETNLFPLIDLARLVVVDSYGAKALEKFQIPIILASRSSSIRDTPAVLMTLRFFTNILHFHTQAKSLVPPSTMLEVATGVVERSEGSTLSEALQLSVVSLVHNVCVACDVTLVSRDIQHRSITACATVLCLSPSSTVHQRASISLEYLLSATEKPIPPTTLDILHKGVSHAMKQTAGNNDQNNVAQTLARVIAMLPPTTASN